MEKIAKIPKVFKINARAKIIITLVFLFFLISTASGQYYILLLYFILSILITIAFKPDFYLLIKRTLLLFLFPFFISIFIPFANKGKILFTLNLNFLNMTITDNGIAIFLTVLLKSFISILLLSSLVISTPDIELLDGLRKIHVPAIIVTIIFIMYRYFFVLKEDSNTGQLAIKSRIFHKSYKTLSKRLTFLAGNLLIKSFDRAENIYKSMESRGFDGNFHSVERNFDAGKQNWVITICFILVMVFVKIIEFLKILS
ncbi:MAG: cobalt ECF transporter T component CbiQ [Actinobacteria bacterium RBG_19FT_COMBO_36_27]|nr:MAG: cobalt ECF transporter T component CbiQ [Actinobacteria bacterium RBG_19FT_COMBO_36_27]